MSNDRSASISGQEHSRLLKALRESELLRELAELLASSLDPTHILQVLVRRTTEACEVGRCAVWLLDEEQTRFRPSAYHFSMHRLNGKHIHVIDRIWRQSTLPFDHPTIAHLLHKNGLLALEELNSEASMQLIAEKFMVRSILLIALVREGRMVGMMSLDNPGKTTVFTREQQQLARAIGQQAAVAIDNARLYQQAQMERQRAERLAERAQSIYQVAMEVNTGEDLSKVLATAAFRLAQGTAAHSAAITLLYDEKALTFENTIFSQEPAAPPTPIHPFAPLAHLLPHCQAATRLEDPYFVTREQLSTAEQRWFKQLGMQHILIVPLLVAIQNNSQTRVQTVKQRARAKKAKQKQRCIGFAFVNYQRAAPLPSKGKRVFARDIAAQCAMAIEKAHISAKAQQALILATERATTLDAVFNAMTEGLVVLDLEGQLIHHNDTATRFLTSERRLPQQLISHLQKKPDAIYTLYGSSIPAGEHPLMRALRGERIRGERFRFKRQNGNEQAIEANIVPLTDRNEQRIGIVGAFRDINEQVRVEQRIRLALDTMLHAAEAVSGIIDIREIFYRVLAMTVAALNCQRGVIQLYDEERQRFISLLSIGFELDEVEQWLAEQQYWLAPNKHQYTDFYAQLLSGQAALIANDNGEVPLEHQQDLILAAPITHNNRLLGVALLTRAQPGTAAPVAEFSAWDLAVAEGIGQFAGLAMEQTRWKHEAEIARTNEASMRKSNALKDEFLAITAHEFRTPLTVIMAHSQMVGRLTQKTENVPPELKARLEESHTFITEQARQLTNIVNTFLEVTRLNRGQISLSLEEVQLEEIAREAIAHYNAMLTNHTLHCRVEPADHPYVIQGDRARLFQIFTNLLQNAIKYSPLGGPITVSLRQEYQMEDKHIIEVCIEDKGIGVPEEAQPHLFERFYRAPNIGGSQARGVGLGLYLVAEFLFLHNGSIRVESNGVEGEGSRFIFTLPLLESSTIAHA